MKKIPTLFIRNPENMKLVTQEVNPEARHLFINPMVIPTIKKDGTNIRITIDCGELVKVEKRRNPTREEKALGAEPGYIDANRLDPADQYIYKAVDSFESYELLKDGQYCCEAMGSKIQGGVESCYSELYIFELFPTVIPIEELPHFGRDLNFYTIKHYLEKTEIEGIVFKTRSTRKDEWEYAKIKRRDFGLEWPIKGK